MNCQAFQEWTALFTNDIKEIWSTEKVELRKAAMMIIAIKNEFKRIEEELSSQLQCISDRYKKFDRVERIPSSSQETERLFDDSIEIISVSSSPLCRTVDFLNSAVHENEISSDDADICSSPKLNRNSKFDKKWIKPNHKALVSKPRKLVHSHSPNLLEDGLDDVVNCTIIEATPTIEPSMKKTRVTIGRANKKRNEKVKKTQISTLTQKFLTSYNDTTCVTEEDIKNQLTQSIPPANIVLKSPSDLQEKSWQDQQVRVKEVICKEAVVRGKAKQKLEGWDCPDCKQVYEICDNTQEAKKLMNKCSRHRATRKPDDDYTIPGFWSLTFPPTQPPEIVSRSEFFGT